MIAAPCDPWFQHFASHVALRRGPGAPVSPSLARDRHAPLEFSVEAAWYLATVHRRRDAADRRCIEQLADAIALPPRTRSLSVVPVFARERSLLPLLSSEAPPDHVHVLLVNAAAAQMTRTAFAAAVARLRDEVDALRARRPTLAVTLLVRHFPRRLPVRHIRGLLTDATVRAAARARLADPLVVYSDADQLAAAPDQLARLVDALARAPRLDFVAGPVWFGLSPDGESHLPGGARLPELFLGNRFLQAAQAARRAGDGVPPHFITQGANVAFRLASLCAGGGLDYRLWEDAQIGWWTAAMRSSAHGRPGYARAHHRFDERAWVVTDPRRILRAILNGRTPEHAWTWEPHDRAPVVPRAATQLLHYRRARALLQPGDVTRARAGDARALDKVRRRVLFHFFAPLLWREPRWVAALAARYGLRFVGLSSRSGAIRDVAWRKSPIVDALTAWVTR